MPGADCESDHNPVVATIQIRLQRVKKAKRTVKWNINNLKRSEIRSAYKRQLDTRLQEERIAEEYDIDSIWNKLKESIEKVAEEICGKEQKQKKHSWMNEVILRKMEERRQCKIRNEAEEYKKLKHVIQKLCREAKDKFFEEKCKEIEMLDKAHSQLLYKKLKELQPKGNRMLQAIKSKQGKSLLEKDEARER